MPVRLAELAVRFGCELKGEPDTVVEGVATLQQGRPGGLAFLANPRYRRYLAGTRASAVVLDPQFAEDCSTAALLSRNPYRRSDRAVVGPVRRSGRARAEGDGDRS